MNEKSTAGPDFHWSRVLERYLSPEQIARLGSARVGIVGAGGLGSNCAMLLTRMGVRHFRLADPDVVDLSNLNRQFFFPEQVGRPKVEALAENLRRINPDPELDITIRQERLDGPSACSYFAGCDLAAEAVDTAAAKHELIHALLEAGFTVVGVSGLGGWGGDMQRKIFGPLSMVGDFSRGTGPGVPPLAPRVSMAAALQADEIVRRILQ